MFQMLPDMPMAAKFFAAFVIVLALIGLTAWLVRRFGANRLNSSARGRQPRLAVIDAASVDGRRRLVLIRRDNVEHLMMIGGPNDVIIEPNIVRAGAARDAGRDQARTGAGDIPPRTVALNENGGSNWPLQPAVEPPMQPPPRSYRSPVSDEPWSPPEPAPREPMRETSREPMREPPREPSLRARPGDSISGMASDFSAKLNAELDAPPPPRMAPVAPPPPMREPLPPAPPSAPPQTDRNLAEMAQRLEAALRRPNANELHPPVTDPLAATASAPPMKAAEPTFEAKVEPKFEPKAEPKLEAEPKPAKNPFDSLEEEMASLLGRSGKT